MTTADVSAERADWQPCSDAARDRGDSMAGSASRGDRWFLVEMSGGWGHSAFLDSPSLVDRDLGLRICRRIEKGGLRTLAVRRPGRAREAQRWRWAIVDTRPGRESIHRGEVDHPEALLDVPLDGSTGTLDPEPMVAVCTHGKHDRCCAVRGRQVLSPLTDEFPDHTWECSHLGGDRFAGTMIVFPHGLYYGNVDESDAAHIVRRHREGRVVPEFLRGRSSYPNPVQVAQHHARLLLGDDRIDTLHPRSAESDDGRWTVVLEHDDGDVHVTLVEGWSTPILTMCSARTAGEVRTYDLVSVETAGG